MVLVRMLFHFVDDDSPVVYMENEEEELVDDEVQRQVAIEEEIVDDRKDGKYDEVVSLEVVGVVYYDDAEHNGYLYY